MEGQFGISCPSAIFEITPVKRGQIFKNQEVDLSRKLSKPNMWLLVNHTKPTNSVLILIFFNSGQLQNNTVNDAMSITIMWLLRLLITISFYYKKSASPRNNIRHNTMQQSFPLIDNRWNKHDYLKYMQQRIFFILFEWRE